MNRRTITDGALLVVALGAAYAMKRLYSTATAEDLDWLLGPATRVVARLTGEPFVREARVGFVAERLPIIVAPACAGVNFLIIAFLTLCFGFVGRMRGAVAKVSWCALCPVLAYAATLVANTCRIATAVGVHMARIRVPFMSPADAHRALGVAVYLVALWTLFESTDALTRRWSHAI